MAKSPADILKKTKATDKKTDKDDDKGEDKSPRKNALLDFIAKSKKASK
jgi:hypothetical protein